MVSSNRTSKILFLNASQQIPVPYGGMLHTSLTNLFLLAAEQALYKKAYLLTKNTEEFSGEKSQANGPAGRKKTERLTGLGRRTREEIVKWNQMTALQPPSGG